MPTATVPPPGATVGDVVDGLRAAAWLILGIRPTVGVSGTPLQADLNVADRASVQAAADAMLSDVTESRVGLVTVFKTSGEIYGVQLTVHTVIHDTSTLRRDPEVTATLAERDA